MSDNARQHQGIQQLRFYAAVMVVLSHSIMTSKFSLGQSVPTWIAFFDGIGVVGVEVFFVVSGFIMGQSSGLIPHEETLQKSSGLLFFGKRLRRVLPLYALLTCIAMLIGDFTKQELFFSLTFLSQPLDGKLPIIGFGWTLEYEMMFYLIISFVLFVPWRKRIWIVIVGLLVAPLLGLLPSIVINFVVGLLVFLLSKRICLTKIQGSALVIFGCLLLTLGWLITDKQWIAQSWIRYGIPTGIIVTGLVCSNIGQRPTAIVNLGNASYSIYLAQWFAWYGCEKLASQSWIIDNFDSVTFVMVSTPLVTGFGFFIYIFLERPLDKTIRRTTNHLSLPKRFILCSRPN